MSHAGMVQSYRQQDGSGTITREEIWPLVTGTFGGVDFLHSVMGEVSDKATQSEIVSAFDFFRNLYNFFSFASLTALIGRIGRHNI